MKLGKRLLALLLVMAMLLSNLPVGALAAELDSSGQEQEIAASEEAMAVLEDAAAEPEPEENPAEDVQPEPEDIPDEEPASDDAGAAPDQQSAPAEDDGGVSEPADEPAEDTAKPSEPEEATVEAPEANDADGDADPDAVPDDTGDGGEDVIPPEDAYDPNDYPPYLSFDGLSDQGDGYGPDGTTDLREGSVQIGQSLYAVFYLNEWNGESYTPTPVHPYSNGGSLALVSMVEEGWDITSGCEDIQDYFYSVRGDACSWDSEILYDLDDGTVLSVPISVELGECSFHWSPDCSPESHMFIWDVRTDGENKVYFRYESDYWTLDSVTWEESQATGQKVDDHIYEFTLTEDFVNSVVDSGGWGYFGVNYSLYDEEGNTGNSSYMLACRYVDRTPYLRFAWLNHENDQLTEDGFNENDGFGIRPGDTLYQVYYLHYYDEASGERRAKPVKVEWDENFLNYQLVSDMAAGGQENHNYFYEITSHAFGETAEVWCWWNNEKVPLTVDVSMQGLTFHSDSSCTVENHITELLGNANQENVFYCRYTSNEWSMTDLRVPEHQGEATPAGPSIWKVTVNNDFLRSLNDNWEPVWIEYTIRSSENGETQDHGDSFACQDRTPRLTLHWLWNDGEDRWYDSGVESDNLGLEGPAVYGEHAQRFVLFLMNQWNENGDVITYPVKVQTDCGGIRLVQDVPAQEGQEFADYFYQVIGTRWNSEGKIYCELEDGTRASMDVNTFMGERSFHMDENGGPESFLMEYRVEPFAKENVFYFRFDSGYWQLQGNPELPEWQKGAAQVDPAGENIWKITLNQQFINDCLGWGQDIHLEYKVIHEDEDGIREEDWSDSLHCRLHDESRHPWVGINGDEYYVYEEGYLRSYNTGEQNEDGYDIWAREPVDKLPDGVTYIPEENRLILEDANLNRLHLQRGWHEWDDEAQEEVWVDNLPEDLTIELRGDNFIISDSENALSLMDGLNTTFVGDGYLKVKASSPRYNAAMDAHGKVTFADNVRVDVEIEGEGVYDDGRPATMTAMGLYDADLEIRDNAQVRTILPEGAKMHGPLTETPDQWGDYAPGGHRSIEVQNVRILGGQLHIQKLDIAEEWDDAGNFIRGGEYVQHGGTVTIDALGGNSWLEDQVELGPHHHYEGLGGHGLDITITGGQLNINIDPNPDDLKESAWFYGIITRGGKVELNGGEINFNANGMEGELFRIENLHRNDAEPIFGQFRITGGSISNNDSGRYSGVFMDLNPGATARFDGGEIVAHNVEFKLGGEVIINDTSFRFQNSALFLDGQAQIDGGRLEGENALVSMNGMVTMNDGSFQLTDSQVFVDMAFIFNGGGIDIRNAPAAAANEDGDNEGGEGTYPAVVVTGYWEVNEAARLSIENHLNAPAIEIGYAEYEDGNVGMGQLLQNGGSIHVMATNEEVPQVFFPQKFHDDGGIWGEPTQGMAMFGGDFVIEGPEGEQINGLKTDPGRWVLLNGGEMTLWNANMDVSHALAMAPDAENHQVAKLNIFGGRLVLSDGAELELNPNAFINIDTTVHNRVEDEWYIALMADWNTSVNIRGGRLNILAENYDCAVDLCGSYVQEGGMVNITARGEDSNNLGMAAKTVFDLRGGGLTITANTCLQVGCAAEEPVAYPRHLEIFDGMLKLYGKTQGIYQEGHLVISGGDVDIVLEGEVQQNGLGNWGFRADGFMPYTGVYEEGGLSYESSLTITGGNVTVAVEGDAGDYENVTNGIWAINSGVKLLGGTYRAYNCMPLYVISENPEDIECLSDELVIYSLESGEKLDLQTYTDDGLYFALLEEDNIPGDIGTDAGMDYNYGALFVIPKAGQNLTWNVENGLLTFDGKGSMYDFGQMAYGESVNAPWAYLADFITTAELNYNSLRRIGSNAFRGLDNLTRLNFKGSMPEFAEDAFAGIEADAFYPVEEQWDAAKLQQYGGKVTWFPDVKTKEVIRINAEKAWLIPGEKLTLDTTLNQEGTTEVIWTLAEESSRFASLGVRNNIATITARNATEPQIVLVSAVAANGQALPVWLELTVYPAAAGVSVFCDTLAQDADLAGETVKFDFLRENKTLQLTAALNPGYLNGELEQPVTWSTSDEDVAVVTEDGIVTITGKGTVKITATAADGSKKKAAVTIVSLEMIQSLRMDEENTAAILGGKSATLKVIDTETGKAPKASEVEWSIQPETGYASISSSGKLTTKAVFEPLTIHVRVASVDNPDAAAVQQVTIYPAVNRVDIFNDGAMVTGGTVYADISGVTGDDLSLIDLTAELSPAEVLGTITWKSSNTRIAKVDAQTGAVTAVLSKGKAVTGTVTITAAATDGSGKSASVKLTLGKPAAEVTITGAESLVAGKYTTLKAAAAAADGGKPTDSSVVWSLADSADSAYVTLTSKGKVTAKTVYEEKEVTIVATSKDGMASAEHTMTIKPKSTNILVILDEANNNVTKSTLILDANQEESTLQLFAEFLNGNEVSRITWSSSNKKYATVDAAEGVVTAVKPGTVTITAKDAASKKTAAVTVKVVKLATGVTVSEKSGKTEELTLAAGKSMTLTAAVADAASKSVTWSVDSELATISSSGVLKASANVTEPITVTVTATARDGSEASGSLNVTLVPLAAGVRLFWDDGERDVTNDTLVWDMVQDETMSLRSQVYPVDANEAATWKSSSTRIARVDDEGLVTFLKPGTVTITATAADGSGKAASFKLLVTKKMSDLLLPAGLMMAGGTSMTLKPAISPEDTSNKDLEWVISGDTAYASISASGKLTAKAVTAPKTVTVTALAQDGSGKQASCEIRIYPATTGVTLWNGDEAVTGKTLPLFTGETLKLTADSAPADAANVCIWTSSDERYVSVDEDGIITAVKAGKTVTITCTAADGTGEKAAVKIRPIQLMKNLTLEQQLEVVGGKSLTLKPVIEPADTTNDELTWTLTGEDLTGVSLSASGKLTTRKVTEAKSVTVTATSQDGTELVAECEVIIRPLAASVQIRSGEENVTGKTLRLVSNQELSLSADVLAEDAMQDVTWKSSSTRIATVEDGVVTPKKTGTVTITATATDGSARKATMKVTVIQAVEEVAVTGKTDIIGGQSLTYKVTASPSNAYNKAVTWAIVSSDLEGVEITPEGVLISPEVQEAHTVTLVATSVENPNIVSNPFDVTIRPAVSEIQLQADETPVTAYTVKKGKTVNLEALIGPEDSLQKVTWKSSSTKIATVSAAGVVKGIKAGKATITCTAADGSGVTAAVSITVK